MIKLALAFLLAPLFFQEDAPSLDLKAGGDPDKRYFLIGQTKKVPPKGFNLAVIMPGGPGTADFLPFVKGIYSNCLKETWLVAEPVSIQWTKDQQVVWPSENTRVPKMKFTTEELVEAIIEEVAAKYKIDRTRIFTLSWSSSGPVAYALSTRKKKYITGSFISMAVFSENFLQPAAVKGMPYYLHHSESDATCPFGQAEQARDLLKKNGARVEFVTYEGGHGWHGNVMGQIKAGFDWLLKQTEPK